MTHQVQITTKLSPNNAQVLLQVLNLLEEDFEDVEEANFEPVLAAIVANLICVTQHLSRQQLEAIQGIFKKGLISVEYELTNRGKSQC